MNHVMLDLETFGTKPGAVIRSIGLVQFSPEGGPLGMTYYANINKDEQTAKGAHLDPNTVAWWAKQSKKAEEALHVDVKSVETVLTEVFNFIKNNKLKLVWSQGSNFDGVLLDNLYERFGYKTPWLYYNTRDTRTIFDLAGFKCGDLPREGTAHNALHDAVHQVRVIQKCYEIIKGKGN